MQNTQQDNWTDLVKTLTPWKTERVGNVLDLSNRTFCDNGNRLYLYSPTQ